VPEDWESQCPGTSAELMTTEMPRGAVRLAPGANP
jgi:hypothetical protein